MQKKRNNPQANPSGFAYVRAALGLALEISSGAMAALAFSMSGHIRIEHDVRYSVVFFFFALDYVWTRALPIGISRRELKKTSHLALN